MNTQDTQSNPIWNVIDKGQFVENPLHGYERTSYDVSLHLANTYDTTNWQKVEKSLKKNNSNEINSISSKIFSGGVITLLESASTITTMTDLTIEGFTSPNTTTDTGFSTKFRMSVVQPLGVSLVENIYKAAAVLGIKNHYSHPFFLQITLKGRKADGEIDVEIPNTRRLYCVYIKNITYSIDVGSANYQIEGIRAGDLNNADDHSLVQKTALTGIETMNDFLNAFQKEVNKQERHKLGSTKAILDQFVFRIDSLEDNNLPLEDLADSRIMADKESKTNSQNQDLEGAVLAEIERNTSIKEVLERFMSRNEVMQNRISGIRTKLTNTNWSKKEIDDIDVEKYLFTITTHNELLTYDPLRRDYARKFVFTITVAPFISITAAVRKEFEKKKEYTKARVKKMMEKTLIKRYDYFHTGMNIDVLNFNINYNYQYVYGLDTMVGLFNKYSEAFNTIINQQVNANADLQKAVKDGIDANKEFNDAQSDGKLSVGEKYWIKTMQQRNLQNIRNLYDTGAVEPDANTLEAYNALVKGYNEDIKNYESIEKEIEAIAPPSVVAKTGTPKLNALDTYHNDAMLGFALAKSGTQKTSRLGGNDVLAEAMPDELYEDALKEDQGGTQFPVQFYERFVDPGQSGMIEVSTADASGFSTILRNAKVGSAEMVRVTMDIIGDPYWLDHPAYGHTPGTDKNGKPVMADYKRENCVLFCSMIPTEKEPDTGYEKTLAQRNNDFLTAVYRVWKIEHKFSNGQFTQTLHMVRDAVTDLSLLVAGDLKKEEKLEDKHVPMKHIKSVFKMRDGVHFEKKEHFPTYIDDEYNSEKWEKLVKNKTLEDLKGTIAAEEIKKGTVDHRFMKKWTDHHSMDPNNQNDVEAIVAASDAGVLSKKGIFDPDVIKKFDYNGDGNITHRGGELADMREYLQKNEEINAERDTDDSPDPLGYLDSSQEYYQGDNIHEEYQWNKERMAYWDDRHEDTLNKDYYLLDHEARNLEIDEQLGRDPWRVNGLYDYQLIDTK